MEISVDNLERAVSQFYHTDCALQAEAHHWLTEVQSSPSAWAVVWELLHPSRSNEAQFFAATTLHTKLMKSWAEVPRDQYDFLKTKLLGAVVQYSSGPKIVLNRLCIALSAYLIQTTPHHWANSLAEVMALFRPDNLPTIQPERVVWILLEVLTVIPEEFQSMALAQRHKNSVRNELEKAAPEVVGVIEGGLSCGGEVRAQAMKALVAWLHVGLPLPSCLPIATTIVAALLEDPTSQCGDVECEALSEIATHPESHRFPKVVHDLLDTFLPLAHIIPTAQLHDNQELVVNAYRAVVGLAENHARLVLSWLVARDNSAWLLLRAVMSCSSSQGDYPLDETQSQLTFTFWYLLQDEMGSVSKEEAEAAREVLVPIYEELSRVLVRKSQYPDRPMSASDAELFRCYRQDIADTLVYCYHVVRGQLVVLLGSLLGSAGSWQEAEAVLAGAFAVAQTSQDDDRLVALLTSVPPTFASHPKVVNTLNQAVGAYSEWLSGQSEALGRLIPGLVAALDSKETSMSATMALKDVTRECTLSLRPFAQPLLHACQEAVNKGELRQSECVRLMYCIGRLVSLLPYQEMARMVEEMAAVYVGWLESLVLAQRRPGLGMAQANWLKMVATLMWTMYLEEGPPLEPPTLILLRRVLPALGGIVSRCLHVPHMLQEVCTCLKNAVTSLLERCEPLLGPILSMTVTCFTAHPVSEALHLVKQVVILFGGGEGESAEMAVETLGRLSSRTLTMCTEEGGSENCDVVQAFLSLVAAIVKRQPHTLAKATDVNRLVAFGVASLVLPEAATVKGAGMFLCHVISQSGEDPTLHAAVQANAQELVNTVIRCIGGECQRSVLGVFSEILLCLNKHWCESLARWLPPAMHLIQSATPDQKTAFTRAVLRQRANKRKLEDTIRELAFQCRGLVTSPDYTGLYPH